MTVPLNRRSQFEVAAHRALESAIACSRSLNRTMAQWLSKPMAVRSVSSPLGNQGYDPASIAAYPVADRLSRAYSRSMRINVLRTALWRCGVVHRTKRCFPCPLWVKSRHIQCTSACPLYPPKATLNAFIRGCPPRGAPIYWMICASSSVAAGSRPSIPRAIYFNPTSREQHCRPCTRLRSPRHNFTAHRCPALSADGGGLIFDRTTASSSRQKQSVGGMMPP